MVWSTIGAIYGYLVKLDDIKEKLEDENDDDNYIYVNDKDIVEHFELTKSDYIPQKITDLNRKTNSKDENDVITIRRINHSGIAVGTRVTTNKCMNFWAGCEVINESFDYSIPEFDVYKDRDGFRHYEFIHRMRCCSKSYDKYAIIGVMYDSLDRNLFLDKKFDDHCDQVFNFPTLVCALDDELFQHDHKNYNSNLEKEIKTYKSESDNEDSGSGDCHESDSDNSDKEDLTKSVKKNVLRYGVYKSKKLDMPNIRKRELLNVPKSVKDFVDSLKKDNKKLFMYPNCYLVMDDCTFCT